MKYQIKYLAAFFLYFQLHTLSFAGDSATISSPNKKITVGVSYSGKLSYTVSYAGKIIVQPSSIDLVLSDGQRLSADLRIIKKFTRSFNETIISPVPEKRREVINNYNELSLQFSKPYTLLLRVYDDGVAYRIVTRFKDSVFIENEVARFNFAEGKKVLLPIIEPRKDVDKYHTSFEQLYQLKSIDSLATDVLAYTPVLTGTGNEIKVAITESDLEDYPGMFLQGTNSNALAKVFAPYPLETKMTEGDFPQEVVTKRATYIAKVKGARSFPWRVLIIAPEDKDLPGNDIVYRLASPSKLQDASWVKPGLGTDEWIININLFNVPFKSGVNTASYKYYIDFAKRFGFQRIMMDAGWSKNSNLFEISPDINMDTLSAYAKSRNIKLSMWTLCSTLDRQLDSALDQFNKWGVDFIMTDFMDRDDQPMVNFYTRIAEACAAHKLMIMFHGAYPPKGFNRTWPNAITREGVLGSE